MGELWELHVHKGESSQRVNFMFMGCVPLNLYHIPGSHFIINFKATLDFITVFNVSFKSSVVYFKIMQ